MPWSAVTSSSASDGSASAMSAASPSICRSCSRHGSEPGPCGGRACRGRRGSRRRAAGQAAAAAVIISAARSPSAYTPRYAPPRRAARVRPEPRKAAALTVVTPMHAASACSSAVGYGLHVLGDEDLAQIGPFGACFAPVEGVEHVAPIRSEVPTSPCAPGGSPVPSEARLTTVLDGNPTVNGPTSARPVRNGASAAWARSSSWPSPSTSSSATARERGTTSAPSVSGACGRGRAAERGDDSGQHLGERAAAVLGHDGRSTPAVCPVDSSSGRRRSRRARAASCGGEGVAGLAASGERGPASPDHAAGGERKAGVGWGAGVAAPTLPG